MKRQIILIARNVRSCHNVGSLLRAADGLGVKKVYLAGITPYPAMSKDSRLPHLAAKINKQIAKTSLGAEKSIDWSYSKNLESVISRLKSDGYTVVALEQSKDSNRLNESSLPEKVVVIVGNEVDGLSARDIELSDFVIEIPMLGRKESFNVATAAAMALYHLRYF